MVQLSAEVEYLVHCKRQTISILGIPRNHIATYPYSCAQKCAHTYLQYPVLHYTIHITRIQYTT